MKRLRNDLSQPILSFAIVADTHVGAEAPNTVPPLENRRTKYVFRQLAAQKPAFVLHLGDIVHPVPALDGYGAAAVEAERLHELLRCPLHATPGNHDIGDKASPWMPAKSVHQDWIDMHRQRFGAVYRAFTEADCRFILICSPILGSGLPEEARQREWLEQELADNAGARLFLATHYPPYLLKPDEPDNYDNIGRRERKWLLGLVERYNVEALFVGHIHNFLFNRHGGTRCYALPSVSFVRRDYAELFRVAPGDREEFGRNDQGRLGFFLVDVFDSGHIVHPISTDGATNDESLDPVRRTPGRHPSKVSRTALGVHSRHSWNEVLELPYNAPTDEFQRRSVRNDYPLLALWQTGVAHLRVPISDFSTPESALRLAALHAAGQRFTVFTAGVPCDRHAVALRRHAKLIDSWEVVLPWAQIKANVVAVNPQKPRPRRTTTQKNQGSTRDT
ncbi:MAG: metallophosphoesterase, partial [Albidovulum sp.]|nr:metallophosphoesterase [Albidovulum sp.]